MLMVQHCYIIIKYVFYSGIGTGAGSSIFGFLTRSTAPEDRATVFAAVMACRQAGLLIGQFSLVSNGKYQIDYLNLSYYCSVIIHICIYSIVTMLVLTLCLTQVQHLTSS